jgi:hypothetical protein
MRDRLLQEFCYWNLDRFKQGSFASVQEMMDIAYHGHPSLTWHQVRRSVCCNSKETFGRLVKLSSWPAGSEYSGLRVHNM